MIVFMSESIPEAKLVEPLKNVRFQVVDALRGFALFGILLVHCAQCFSSLPESLYQTYTGDPLNAFVAHVIELLFTDRSYSFFSFMFELSFALMMSRW